ncbi:hypothetical protein [Dulcicalothrix desertica]|nr:hypothetical protein [Dulcicalothrix desertica]
MLRNEASLSCHAEERSISQVQYNQINYYALVLTQVLTSNPAP